MEWHETSKSAVIFFATVIVLAMALIYVMLKGPVVEPALDCDIQAGGCRKRLGDRIVELEIQPRPVVSMQDLTFQVRIIGRPLSAAPAIDLGMPAMEMGPNHVDLRKTGENRYAGRGLIVHCPSGKTIWQATVTLPGDGEAVFTFDVIY